jgi:hypothetical protein
MNITQYTKDQLQLAAKQHNGKKVLHLICNTVTVSTTGITCSAFLGPHKHSQVFECPVAVRSVTSEDNVFKTSGRLRTISVSYVSCTMFRNIKIY